MNAEGLAPGPGPGGPQPGGMLSPSFVCFLEHVVRGSASLDFQSDWGEQTGEQGVVDALAADAANLRLAELLRELAQQPAARLLIERTLATRDELLRGGGPILAQFQQRVRVHAVVAAPRQGGSYLTKALARGLGYEPRDFPAWFVHDGTPDPRPQFLAEPGTAQASWMHYAIDQTAEWMTMAQWFAAEWRPRDATVDMPKKLLKSVYAGAFVRDVLGPRARYVVALRHPAAACVSVLERAGGLPASERFPREPRTLIELWVQRALRHMGYDAEHIAGMAYFHAFVAYWEDFHQRLLVGGPLCRGADVDVLAYGRSAFESFRAGGEDLVPEAFQVHRKTHARPDWLHASLPALDRVQALWRGRDMPFPRAEIDEAW